MSEAVRCRGENEITALTLDRQAKPNVFKVGLFGFPDAVEAVVGGFNNHWCVPQRLFDAPPYAQPYIRVNIIFHLTNYASVHNFVFMMKPIEHICRVAFDVSCIHAFAEIAALPNHLFLAGNKAYKNPAIAKWNGYGSRPPAAVFNGMIAGSLSCPPSASQRE